MSKSLSGNTPFPHPTDNRENHWFFIRSFVRAFPEIPPFPLEHYLIKFVFFQATRLIKVINSCFFRTGFGKRAQNVHKMCIKRAQNVDLSLIYR